MMILIVFALYLAIQVKCSSSNTQLKPPTEPLDGSVFNKSQAGIPRIDINYGSMEVKVMGYQEYTIRSIKNIDIFTNQESLFHQQIILQHAFDIVDRLIGDLCEDIELVNGVTIESNRLTLSYRHW